MSERRTDDGLGIAQLTGYPIAHEVVAGFAETVALKECSSPKPMKLVECGLDGGRALKEGELSGYDLSVLLLRLGRMASKGTGLFVERRYRRQSLAPDCTLSSESLRQALCGREEPSESRASGSTRHDRNRGLLYPKSSHPPDRTTRNDASRCNCYAGRFLRRSSPCARDGNAPLSRRRVSKCPFRCI